VFYYRKCPGSCCFVCTILVLNVLALITHFGFHTTYICGCGTNNLSICHEGQGSTKYSPDNVQNIVSLIKMVLFNITIVLKITITDPLINTVLFNTTKVIEITIYLLSCTLCCSYSQVQVKRTEVQRVLCLI
jgi:hypothetical protein